MEQLSRALSGSECAVCHNSVNLAYIFRHILIYSSDIELLEIDKREIGTQRCFNNALTMVYGIVVIQKACLS